MTGTLDDVNVILKTSKNADGSINGIILLNEVENTGGINILRSPKWGDMLNKHTFTNETGKTITDWIKVSDEFWETINKKI